MSGRDEPEWKRSITRMKSRTDAVYDALKEKGYPDDFCREIAYKHMNTDYTATRMLGYLYRISNPRPEDVVDEMLAILSDRNAIIQKKLISITSASYDILTNNLSRIICYAMKREQIARSSQIWLTLDKTSSFCAIVRQWFYYFEQK